MPLPPFTAQGDLPPGLHRATLAEVLERFGSGSPQRMLVGLRLERMYHVQCGVGHRPSGPLCGVRVVGDCQADPQ